MKIIKLILAFLFGAVMILAGLYHFIKPEIFAPFIAKFLPNKAINYLAGLLEIALGIGVFTPKFRSTATLGILLLMIVFLPLHIVDVFKENPAIGSREAALIRLPIQFVLILWAWFINKNDELDVKPRKN